MLLQRARRGADHGALPAGPDRRLRLHRARPGGRRRRRRARARRRRRRRCRSTASRPATTPAASRSPTCSATSSARARARRAGATGTCTSACPSWTSSRSSRCSATSCPVCVGAALAFKRRGEPRVALTFLGEGAFCVGRRPRGAEPRGRPAGPGRLRPPEQPLRVLDADRAARCSTRASPTASGAAGRIPCARVDGTDALADYEASATPSSRRAPARARKASRR